MTVSAPLTYSVCVSNQGPNIARSAVAEAALSDNQTIQSVVASSGTAVTSGHAVTFSVGDLAVAASATVTIITLPQSAGSLTCTASASSQAIDSDFTEDEFSLAERLKAVVQAIAY